jgi:hypothetical protein
MAEELPAQDVVPQDEATVRDEGLVVHDADHATLRAELAACRADRDALRMELEACATAHAAQQSEWTRTERRLQARIRQLQRSRLGDSRW